MGKGRRRLLLPARPLILVALLVTGGQGAVASGAGPSGCPDATARDPGDPGAYRCWLLSAAARNQWDEVAERLEARLDLDEDDAPARLTLGILRGRRGQFAAAESQLREAARRFQLLRRADGQVQALVWLAHQLGVLGRLEDAGGVVAEAVAAAAGDPLLEAWAGTAAAWQMYRRARYGEMLDQLQAVEDAVFRLGGPELQAHWLSARGAGTWAVGRLADSLATYRREALLLRSQGDQHQEATALSNVALLTGAAIQGRPLTDQERRQIEGLVGEALSAARAGGNRAVEAKSHIYLAQLALAPAQVRAHLERALQIHQRLDIFQDRLLALRLLAENLASEEPRDPARSAWLMDQATDLAYSRGDLQSQARAWLVRSELAWEEWLRPGAAAGQREQAVVSSLAALDAIESIRELQPDREVRAGAFSRWVFAYRRFAGRLLWPPGESPAPEDVALAFQVMERMRARTLLEAMDAAGATPAASPDTTPALALERLQVDMGRLSRGLGSPGLTGPQRRDLLAKLADLRLQASRLRDELARLDASYAALHAPVVAGLSQVREALLPDEALLLFQVANREGRNRSFEGGSWLLAVTRGGEAVHALPDLEEVQHAVALLVGLMDSDAALLATAAGRLYRDLLGEALARLPSRVGRLVIVADGPLHALPFEVLRERPGAPLLSERFLLSRSPSATAWLRWRLSPATTADRPALVLADPEHHAGPDDPAGLGPLPHARHEARALARALGRETKVLLGAAASEAALRPSGVSGFGILHLAAHTVVDEAEPGNSAVLLAPGGGGEDGWLRLKEVVALDLEGRAVVLSACRGAAGPQVDGEGMVSLAWAFFLGGARAVVASLWPLRDDEAGPLIGEFYRQLGRGRSMDEALARAQALRRAQGVAPSGWAGLRIIGDGHLIPFPSGGPGWVLAWWHLAALAGALAGACVWRALSLSRRRAWLAAAGL